MCLASFQKSAAGFVALLRLSFMVISDYTFCFLLDRDLNCHCLSQLVVVTVACRGHVYHDLVPFFTVILPFLATVMFLSPDFFA